MSVQSNRSVVLKDFCGKYLSHSDFNQLYPCKERPGSEVILYISAEGAKSFVLFSEF